MDMTTGQVLAFSDYLTDSIKQRLQDIPCPVRVCGREVPKNLNDLTIGQLIRISNASRDDIAFVFCREILGIDSKKKVVRTPARVVVPFLFWTAKEIERITKMFNSLKVNYTNDELQAGVKKLDSGSFGILDWYATRMGYKDHNEVMNVPWLRIWQCTKIDTDINNYNRRLHDIMTARINNQRH
jgi:hypothetical protein